MKILHIVCDGAPGGGTNHVMQLLNGLGSKYERELLTQEDSYLYRQARENGFQVYGGQFFRSRLDPRAMRRIRDVVRTCQPDLIHCHGGRAAFFQSFNPRATPVVYTVHGFHHANKNTMAKAMGWLAEYQTIRKLSHVIFVSNFDRQLAIRQKLLPSRMSHSVIHNGIAPPQADPNAEKIGVGFVGRFVYQKNPELFLDVVEKIPSAKFVMVGGGELDEKIRGEIRNRGLSDRVELLGKLGHADTIRVLSRLDILLMTPRWEGLPLLPLEAMFLKVPVVSTAVGGIPEILIHRETGMLEFSESAEQLANHIRELQSDARLRQQMVNQAFDFASDHFLENTMIQKTASVYQDVMSASRLERN